MERSPSRAQDMPGTATSPTPEKASVWEDFLDILYAPSSVFARRENGSFWIPLLVVTLILGIIFLANSRVMDPIMQAEQQRAMAKAMAANPNISPEMMQQQMQQMAAVTGIITKVFTFIGIPLVIFFVGLSLYLAGKLFGAKQTFHAALVVAAYSYVPRIIEAVVSLAQGFFVDPANLDGRYRVSIGIGRFLDPDTTSPALLGLLGRVDVFTIWVTVLLAIGLSVTGRIPRGRAALAAALVWLIGALPGMAGGLFS